MQCSQPISAPASARVCVCVLVLFVKLCVRVVKTVKKKSDAGCREMHHVLFDVTRSSAQTVYTTLVSFFYGDIEGKLWVARVRCLYIHIYGCVK